MWLPGVILALFFVSSAIRGATVESSLTPTSAHIGDELILTISVTGAIGKTVSFPIPAVDGFELLGIDSANVKENLLHFTLALYDTGSFELQPLPVIVSAGATAETLRTQAHRVRIETILSDTDTSLRAIKPYLEHPFQWRELLAYWWVTALALAGLVGWWVWNKFLRKGKAAEMELPTPLLPPYEEALRGLISLKDQKYPSRGMVKEFYSEFSHVMKRYLERRYDFPALEMTTYELEYYCETYELPVDLRTALIPTLREGDLVKFAKHEPDPRHPEECLELGFKILESTRPIERSQAEGQAVAA